MSEWISINDKLPPMMSPVITTDGKRVTQTYRTDKDGSSFAAWALNKVTHWMPLPEPPK